MNLNISERYKQIEDYPEYFITESGEVYTYRTRGVGWQGFRHLAKRGINSPKRYLQVCLCKNGIKKVYTNTHVSS